MQGLGRRALLTRAGTGIDQALFTRIQGEYG